MNILAVITARGGSKGIPGKNIRPVAGMPLIGWTIHAARGSKRLSHVLVSTDDDDIARVCREHGADVPFVRPSDLAGDRSPHVPVILHALNWMTAQKSFVADYVLLLQPTSPLRRSEDIDGAIACAESSGADAVVGVCEAWTHPFLIKGIDDNGRLKDYVPKPDGYLARQSFPPAFSVNGAIYLIRPEVLRKEATFYPANTVPYVMPQERSIDVDTLGDLHMVDLLLRNPS